MLLYQSAQDPKTPDIQVLWNTANNSAQDVLSYLGVFMLYSVLG